jgi:hypothetical protein
MLAFVVEQRSPVWRSCLILVLSIMLSCMKRCAERGVVVVWGCVVLGRECRVLCFRYALLAPGQISSLTLCVTHAGGLSSFTPMTGLLLVVKDLFTSKTDVQGKVERQMKILLSSSTLADPDSTKFRRLQALLAERVGAFGGTGCNSFGAFVSQCVASDCPRVASDCPRLPLIAQGCL